MRVTVLGASATYPSSASPASGYLLRSPTTALWMDAGSGTFSNLQRHLAVEDLAAVFLSHQHADHCSDAIGLLYALRHGSHQRDRVPILCPDEVAAALARFVGGAETGAARFADVATFEDPGDGGERVVGDLSLTFRAVNHPVPTLGVRATHGGRVFAYTADSGPSDQLIQLARDADLLLSEATYQGASDDKPWPHHLTAGEAGEVARTAGVGRLVLTHIWPEFDPERSVWEAGQEFDGPIDVAVPDITFDV